MRVFSSVRKLRVQKDGVVLVFADGKYDIEPDRTREIMLLLKGVDLKIAKITNSRGEQINAPKIKEKKSDKKREASNASPNRIRR